MVARSCHKDARSCSLSAWHTHNLFHRGTRSCVLCRTRKPEFFSFSREISFSTQFHLNQLNFTLFFHQLTCVVRERLLHLGGVFRGGDRLGDRMQGVLRLRLGDVTLTKSLGNLDLDGWGIIPPLLGSGERGRLGGNKFFFWEILLIYERRQFRSSIVNVWRWTVRGRFEYGIIRGGVARHFVRSQGSKKGSVLYRHHQLGNLLGVFHSWSSAGEGVEVCPSQ